MTDTSTRAAVEPTRGLPTALVLATIVLATGFQLLVFLIGLMVASDKDIHAPEGVIANLQSIGLVAGVALVVAFAISIATRKSYARAKVGAIVLGSLAVLSLPVFWAGGPAIFGANAAWVGGLTRGGTPQSGVARGFAIAGLVVAVLNVVAVLVLTGGSLVMHGYSG